MNPFPGTTLAADIFRIDSIKSMLLKKEHRFSNGHRRLGKGNVRMPIVHGILDFEIIISFFKTILSVQLEKFSLWLVERIHRSESNKPLAVTPPPREQYSTPSHSLALDILGWMVGLLDGVSIKRCVCWRSIHCPQSARQRFCSHSQTASGEQLLFVSKFSATPLWHFQQQPLDAKLWIPKLRLRTCQIIAQLNSVVPDTPSYCMQFYSASVLFGFTLATAIPHYSLYHSLPLRTIVHTECIPVLFAGIQFAIVYWIRRCWAAFDIERSFGLLRSHV